MSMARLVITAVTIEGRSKSEVAREYGVSRVWVQKLIHCFEADGEAAFEPRSCRPHSNPYAVDLVVEEQIVRLRKQLSKDGLDAGAETIAAHLQINGVSPVPAVSTIWRILSRRGFVVGQPQKRPRFSWHRFCAEQPNERWQADITHWRLADGAEVEILNILDDHCRSTSPLKLAASPSARRWSTPSPPPSAGGASRPACSPIMGRSSPPSSAARAGSRWRSSSDCAGSGCTTPGRTIRRPAARWNGSIRPRRNGCGLSPGPPLWSGCNTS